MTIFSKHLIFHNNCVFIFSSTKRFEYINNFYAPFVKGSRVKIGLKYMEEYHIKANDTILVLGEIIDLYIEDELVKEDGFVDLVKAKTVSINGLDAYVFADKNKRLAYQRPKKS